MELCAQVLHGKEMSAGQIQQLKNIAHDRDAVPLCLNIDTLVFCL